MGASITGSSVLGSIKLFLLDGLRIGFRHYKYVLDRFFLYIFRLQGFLMLGNSNIITFIFDLFIHTLQKKLRASSFQNFKLASLYRTDYSSGEICIIGSIESWNSLRMYEYNYYLQRNFQFSNIQGKNYTQDDSRNSHCRWISWIDIIH